MRVLEIGAGGTSFADWFWPEVTLTSYSEAGGTSAEDLKYGDNSFDLIIAKDVLHHLKNIPKAFKEFQRVLSNRGLVIASEPSWSLLGRFVYKYLHEEPWEVNKDFIIDSTDPWFSNQALIWNLLRLEPDERRQILSGFEIKVIGSTYGFSYLLSGGVHSTTKISSKLLLRLHILAKKFPLKLDSLWSLNRIILMRKFPVHEE